MEFLFDHTEFSFDEVNIWIASAAGAVYEDGIKIYRIDSIKD